MVTKIYHVSEFYRPIETLYIKTQVENEVDKEFLEKYKRKIFKRDEKPFMLPFWVGILLYLMIVVFIIIITYFTIFYFEALCLFLETPLLKPIILAVPSAIIGLHAHFKDEKRKNISKNVINKQKNVSKAIYLMLLLIFIELFVVFIHAITIK